MLILQSDSVIIKLKNIEECCIMKNLKSLLACVLVCILLCATVFPAFASESPYLFLLNCGYPKEYLDGLSDEMILKMRNIIGDNTIVSVTKESAILYENINNIQPYGSLEESDMIFNVYCSEICQKGTDNITRVLISIEWEWKGNKPLVRKQDAISVNWDNSIFNYVEDSFYAQCFMRASSANEWTCFKELTTLSASSQGGVGFYNSFAYSSGHNYFNRGTAILLIQPNNAMKTKTGDTNKDVSTGINFEYVHDRLPLISGSVSFSYNGVGIGIQYNGLAADSVAKTKNFYFSR